MPFTLQLKKPSPCAECGFDPAFHGLERFTVTVGEYMNPFMRVASIPMQLFVPWVELIVDAVGAPVARGLSYTGLVTLVDRPDMHSSETAQSLWEEAKKRGIMMYEVRILGLPRRMFFAEFKKRELDSRLSAEGGPSSGRRGNDKKYRIAFEGIPRKARVQPSLLWIDDKGKMKERFLRAGFPVAKGGVCKTEKEALALLHKLERPVIAKPHIGSGGRHTTVHIETEEGLWKAFRSAHRLSPKVMIEEELVGPVFRATLVAGKLIAVLRRDPPIVVGDGVRTVRELVEEENKNPLRRGPIFADISLENPYATIELARAGLTEESVPTRGRAVQLHFKVNWGIGGTSRDATDEVHPDNIKLFKEVGRYLGDDIIGIDFMVSDIGKSWKEQERCGIIECNSLPHIGNHHFPFTGKVRNVAGAVWSAVFPMSSPT